MSSIQQLFTERFRPKDINSLIAPPRVKDEVSKGLVQNLLLYGTQGTGKTSLCFILSKNYQTLYINASLERGIDIIREKIPKFCATISLEGGKDKLKCVFLDELDGATEEFFDAFKANMERYANNVRFIATSNYINKIPEPIQSRFNCISFDPIDKKEEDYLITEYKKRILTIFNAAKISCSAEILNKFIKNDFPDMRSLLNKVQSFYLRGIKELNETNFNINYDFVDLYKLCVSKPDPVENYKFVVSEYGSKINDALNSLGTDFVKFIESNKPDKIDKIPMIIIAVAEAQQQVNFVIDKTISLLAIVFKIQMIINS